MKYVMLPQLPSACCFISPIFLSHLLISNRYRCEKTWIFFRAGTCQFIVWGCKNNSSFISLTFLLRILFLQTIFSRNEKWQGKNVNIFDRAAVKKCIRKIAGNMTTKVVKAQKKKKKKGWTCSIALKHKNKWFRQWICSDPLAYLVNHLIWHFLLSPHSYAYITRLLFH